MFLCALDPILGILSKQRSLLACPLHVELSILFSRLHVKTNRRWALGAAGQPVGAKTKVMLKGLTWPRR